MIKYLNAIDVEKVYAYLKDNNLTKKAFAKKCGFQVTTLNRYLGKYACGYLSGVDKIRKAMGIKFHELFKNEPVQFEIVNE